jgi:glycosyltransferase involved in cell wall biosynthesis
VGEVVRCLAKAQASLGVPVSIVAIRDRRFEEDAPRWPGIRIVGAEGLGPYSFGFSSSIRSLIRGECEPGALIHSHGMWMYPQLAVRWAADAAGVALVVSPHGMLETWALRNGSALKRVAWLGWERRTLEGAAMIHVTSESEAATVRRAVRNRNVAVVPPGIDVPAGSKETDRLETTGRLGFPDGRRILLFVSRLHAVKGVDLLVRAWTVLAREFPQWRLVIAGPETDGSGVAAWKEIDRTGLADTVRFLGEVNAREREVLLELADLFVLPSRSENFGMVVAESLAAGRPVLTTTETPWQEMTRRRCGWAVTPDAAEITEGLRHAMQLPRETLREMGGLGREWILQEFSWRSSAERMLAAYAAATNRAEA